MHIRFIKTRVEVPLTGLNILILMGEEREIMMQFRDTHVY